MNQQQVLEVISRHTREVIPGLEEHRFQFDDSLKDLGANSVDRSEIIMMTLDSLSLSIPLIEVARAESLGELAGILQGKLQHSMQALPA
jgi:polyketide biosynthesis acyl carrier protein